MAKAKEINPILKEECTRLAGKTNFDLPGAWDASSNAAVCVRAMLRTMGKASGESTMGDSPEARTLRGKLAAMLLPVFEAGAPINFRRGVLVALKLAPEMTAKAERASDDLESKVD